MLWSERAMSFMFRPRGLEDAMSLNLLKLCVGAESVEDLEGWIGERMAARRAAGEPEEQIHTTRMVPKRIDELLDGGSLFWVIKGGIQCRQRLLDIRPFTDSEGIGRCHLVLEPVLSRTEWQPRRPFQGWRYLVAGRCTGRSRRRAATRQCPPRCGANWRSSDCSERLPTQAIRACSSCPLSFGAFVANRPPSF
jgi:hypothetical protein